MMGFYAKKMVRKMVVVPQQLISDFVVLTTQNYIAYKLLTY